jgi:hypothetical protein
VRKLLAWIDGWMATWRIRRNNPELYSFLCSDESRNPDNYVEVHRPGKPGQENS